MAHIQWSDDLNTNISVIDSQHKRIVGYINNLEDVKDKDDRAVEEQVLNELVDYTLSLIHISEPTRQYCQSRIPSSG
mgnify:CR=1 FL=1